MTQHTEKLIAQIEHQRRMIASLYRLADEGNAKALQDAHMREEHLDHLLDELEASS